MSYKVILLLCELTKITYSSAPSVCDRGIVDGAWIASKGYTYKIQIPDNLFPLADQQASYDIPVGSAVHFYCSDPNTRPKVDAVDLDPDDGIISAVCTHRGYLNINMDPSGN